MLNYIWAGMIILSVLYGMATGRMEQVGNGAIESTKEAVSMCITMLGIMSMWMGFMEVAQKSGLIAKAEPIVTNIIANILGLGWAATPAGLKAMEALAENPLEQSGYVLSENKSEIKRQRKRKCTFPKHIATDEMCTFLVLNISSLQIIPVNIIAYRSQYSAVNPSAVVLPAIIATSFSTGAGILWCKIMSRE